MKTPATILCLLENLSFKLFVKRLNEKISKVNKDVIKRIIKEYKKNNNNEFSEKNKNSIFINIIYIHLTKEYMNSLTRHILIFVTIKCFFY